MVKQARPFWPCRAFAHERGDGVAVRQRHPDKGLADEP